MRRWIAQDAAGRSLGALSGRAGTTSTVGGATISLDYGTPSKRGRTIWGALVPFGGRPLHLVLGSGTRRGWLSINRQTGQAGTAYDPSGDLGRVRLSTRPLPAPVETLTLRAEAEPANHLLKLQWDTSERVVPFRVRAK